MDESTRDDSSRDWLQPLRILRRRIFVVIACLVIVPAAAVAFSLIKQKEYTASATLLFKDPQFDQELFGTSVSSRSADPTRAAATNTGLISLNVTAQAAARHLPRLSAAAIRNKVTVKDQGESDLVAVSAVDHDPKLAARIANTFARSFINLRRARDRNSITEARRLIENQLTTLRAQKGPRGQITRLQASAQQLGVLAALQTGNAQLVQPALAPGAPSSPRPVRNTLLGVILGGLLGVALAFGLDRFDRSLREPREAEEAFGRPILGFIPASRTLGPRTQPSRAETEAFLLLRASLRYFNVDRELRSILVTSAASGEGKTTIAWNLALAVSYSEPNVLLIEADLRRPNLGPDGGSTDLGLTSVLAGSATLPEAVRAVTFGDNNGAGPSRTMHVLAAGPVPPNPGELLESERMRALIKQAEQRYSLVVIDTPPVAVVSDAIPLLKEVGGTIIVARLNRSSRHSLSRLNDQLGQLGIVPLGIVVNSMPSRDAYGYGYGSYTYTGAQSSDSQPDAPVAAGAETPTVSAGAQQPVPVGATEGRSGAAPASESSLERLSTSAPSSLAPAPARAANLEAKPTDTSGTDQVSTVNRGDDQGSARRGLMSELIASARLRGRQARQARRDPRN